jgi:hypothetical protein
MDKWFANWVKVKDWHVVQHRDDPAYRVICQNLDQAKAIAYFLNQARIDPDKFPASTIVIYV